MPCQPPIQKIRREKRSAQGGGRGMSRNYLLKQNRRVSYGKLRARSHAMIITQFARTSRIAVAKSSSARFPSPIKVEPCMIASVLGLSDASRLKVSSVCEL
jgi:hypothetical protein